MDHRVTTDQEVADSVLPELKVRPTLVAGNLLYAPAAGAYGPPRPSAGVQAEGLARALERFWTGGLEPDVGVRKKYVNATRRVKAWSNFSVDRLGHDEVAEFPCLIEDSLAGGSVDSVAEQDVNEDVGIDRGDHPARLSSPGTSPIFRPRSSSNISSEVLSM